MRPRLRVSSVLSRGPPAARVVLYDDGHARSCSGVRCAGHRAGSSPRPAAGRRTRRRPARRAGRRQPRQRRAPGRRAAASSSGSQSAAAADQLVGVEQSEAAPAPAAAPAAAAAARPRQRRQVDAELHRELGHHDLPDVREHGLRHVRHAAPATAAPTLRRSSMATRRPRTRTSRPTASTGNAATSTRATRTRPTRRSSATSGSRTPVCGLGQMPAGARRARRDRPDDDHDVGHVRRAEQLSPSLTSTAAADGRARGRVLLARAHGWTASSRASSGRSAATRSRT